MGRTRKTYDVTAKRWKRGWELHIDGVGVTQSRSLAEAESMVRDYVGEMLNIDPESVRVNMTITVDRVLDEEVIEMRRLLEVAKQAQETASAASRRTIRALSDKGLSGRDIARVLEVSPQRVSQLLNDELAGNLT